VTRKRNVYAERTSSKHAAAVARADHVEALARLNRCERCGGGMVLGQPGVHRTCAPGEYDRRVAEGRKAAKR
jgi:hypothetical protein